jgi:hypothetical protein
VCFGSLAYTSLTVAIDDAKASVVTLSISVITYFLVNGPEHHLDAEVGRVFYVPQSLASRFAGAAVACDIV